MKILLADDHPMIRDGMKSLLRKLDDHVTLIEAPDYPGVFNAAATNPDLDLVLLDLYMPGLPGLEGIRRFRERHPDMALVVMSADDEPENIQRIMALGAMGYILKSSTSQLILSALRLVVAGGVYMPSHNFPDRNAPDGKRVDPNQKLAALTQRQLSVLKELVSGKSNHQIAEKLQVTEGTVKIHLTSIFRILKVNNRTEALLAAQRMGIR
jgi:DNA-binding NarL/FixJ family response regulator